MNIDQSSDKETETEAKEEFLPSADSSSAEFTEEVSLKTPRRAVRRPDRFIDIFISYRVDPDEPAATLLRDLLENSFDPAPQVFVSGVGGIRPSHISAIPQMQTAAQQAKAFVAIITSNSKEKEWIFFEAGAAWGQGKLYAPLAVDVAMTELPNTITGYQATKLEDRGVLELLKALADIFGLRVRRSADKRVAEFLEQMRSYPNIKTVKDDEVDHNRALMKALTSKRYDEADSIMLKLEEKYADGSHERSVALVNKIIFDSRKNKSQIIDDLELLPESVHSSPYYHYHLAEYESRLHVSIQHCLSALGLGPNDFLKSILSRKLATLRHSLGHRDVAIDDLVDLLDAPARVVRTAAAVTLLRLGENFDILSRLMLASLALGGDLADGDMRLVAETSSAEMSPFINIHLAQNYANVVQSGHAYNSLGLALWAHKFTNLAYDAFMRASELGTSVSVINAANLVSSSGVASAGRRLIAGHQGGRFDARSPSYPFEVQVDIEQKIHKEQTSVDELDDIGCRMMGAISEFAYAASLKESASTQTANYSIAGAGLIASINGGRVLAFRRDTEDSTDLKLRRLLPFRHAWAATVDECDYLFVLTSDGLRCCLRINLKSKAPEVAWLLFEAKNIQNSAELPSAVVPVLPLLGSE